MFTKMLLAWLVLGLLAACSALPPVDLETPSPSKAVEGTSTPENTASPQAGSSQTGFDCGDVQEIPLEECEAIVTLYERTNGDTWADNTGWLEAPSPCSWYGVICRQGHVVELQLYYNQLAGSLPDEIGNLTQLKSLYLDRDQLSGPVPAKIGNLKELKVARLGGNQFNSIPMELAGLNKLVVLELWGNQLSGEIPGELGNLSNLQVLNLRSNQLTGRIPAELGKLTNLTYLDLSRNQLDGPVPAELGKLVLLNELNLSFNQLTGPIFAEFGNLKALYLLDLSYNQLTGEAPDTLASAPLADIRLWGNRLNGTIPTSSEEKTQANYGGVQFEIGSMLAESIWPELVKAQPLIQNGLEWEVRPEHVRFTVASPREQANSQLNRAGFAGQPQILIYPARKYAAMNEFAKAEIEVLQSMLESHSSPTEGKLPLLPLINASQVFHAQEKYIDFQNGSGVRFITQYSQDISPITNRNLFYTFQGLTEDGSSYISAYFPITAKGLSEEPEIIDWDAFSAGYQGYLTQTVNDLNALSPDEFEPNLESLDQVIQSMRVEAR